MVLKDFYEMMCRDWYVVETSEKGRNIFDSILNLLLLAVWKVVIV